MPVPAVTLTSGAPAPQVGAPAGPLDAAVAVAEQLLGAEELHRDAAAPVGDGLALHAAERSCGWAGCGRTPTSAVEDQRGRIVVCAEH